jgi:hypothetical protein
MTQTQELSIEQKIFRLIMARGKNKAQGHPAAIKRDRILAYVNAVEAKRGIAAPFRTQDRGLRRKVRAMQRKGYPIGSHSKWGYFAIKTRQDLRLTIEEREKKQRALGQSIAWDRRAFENKVQYKLRLAGSAA